MKSAWAQAQLKSRFGTDFACTLSSHGSPLPVDDKKLLVADLVPGMFVSRLDRPWTDTVFPLQGLLIGSDEDLNLLRQYCRYVHVDPKRSLVRVGTQPEQQPLPQPSRWRRLLALFRPRHRKPRALDVAEEKRQLDAQAVFTHTPDGVIPAPDLTRAEEVCTVSAEVLNTVLEDVRHNRELNFEHVEEAVDGIINSIADNPHALFWLTQIKANDDNSYQHAINVAVYMVSLGRHLSLPREQLEYLGIAGLVQDIGMLRVSPEILQQATPLTPEQFQTVKQHVNYGLEVLRTSRGLRPEVLEIVAQHHERYDGSGYLRGLAGNRINQLARIAGIADCYDAMISPRDFRPAISINEALQNLYSWRGATFPEGLVERFIQCVGIYPVGTQVELNTGEIAVVIAQNKIRRLRPRLLVLRDAEKKPYRAAALLDLIKDPKAPGNIPYFIVRDLALGTYGIDPKEYFL